ncbi:helix-turn-helix domain-containing protein [Lactococcus formosensis]|uniref:Helix-turn-helix domain-containing protein n=1 Tax=Lactococcus formosensis TaxID=1281486 RepID=A0A9X4P722_9LACT|nr:helix-turn-helix transcriptional regulator [Lactococcus formosensis]MDG6143668.1 helix-turn-helix domain-containing protein [Lactococcus formosensis]MDG6160811.1 helix-turn-helix domain-containing protein [Lactococcus formosensis]MDG6194366.1 helix-turn-helix domain-containing protein [Lactococcus formosensis]
MVVNRLKEVLEERKMSFSDLRNLLFDNKKIKVNNSQLSLYANGKRNPRNKKLWLDISEVLNLKLQDIVNDIDAYLYITQEISETRNEKNSEIENGKRNTSLFHELITLIDETKASELEKVQRYCSLAATFEKLGADILEEGAVIYVPSGDYMVKKTNPAIVEQVRVNAALIKLDEFFEEKRATKPKNNTGKDWSKFTT